MTTNILVVVEPGVDGFDEGALASVALAQRLAAQTADVTVLVLGGGPLASAPDWDVARVMHAVSQEPLDGLAAQRVVGRVIDQVGAQMVLCPHSGLSVDYAAAVAAERDYGFVANAMSVEDPASLRVQRGRYGGRVVEDLVLDSSRTCVITLRSGGASLPPSRAAAQPPQVLAEPTAHSPAARRLSVTPAPSAGVDITKADVILAIGRGVGEEANVERFERIAQSMGATLAASRPLVDVGWVESARQVGQSGRTVKPKVYIALGISGSLQHVAGMRGSGTVIAVNRDPGAPIFEVASYGAVMDILELADALEAEFSGV